MPIPHVMDSLRIIAPLCPRGESDIMKAIGHLEDMLRQIRSMQEDPRLPLTVPQR